MNSQCLRLFPGAAAMLVLICVSGCTHTREAPQQPSPVRSSALVSYTLATVQRSVEYRRARLAFEQRDYASALARIRQLLASDAGQRPEVHAFLVRQQDICEAARSGRRTQGVSGRGASRVGPRPTEQADCGPRALALVCDKLGVRTSVPDLRRLAGTTGRGTTLAGLEKAARAVGLEAEGVQMDRAALARLATPAVAWANGDHFVAVLLVAGDEATVHDPNHTGEEVIKTDELLRRSGGILLTLSR